MKYVFLKLILTAFTVLTLSLSAFSANAQFITVTPNVAGPLNIGDFFQVDLVATDFTIDTVGGNIGDVTFNSSSIGSLGGIAMTASAVINAPFAPGAPFSNSGTLDVPGTTLIGLRTGAFPEVSVVDGTSIVTLFFQATSAGLVDIIINPNGWGDAVGTAFNVDGVKATVEVSAVPLPPAVLLFGSALLGLVSIRRKQA